MSTVTILISAVASDRSAGTTQRKVTKIARRYGCVAFPSPQNIEGKRALIIRDFPVGAVAFAEIPHIDRIDVDPGVGV